MTASQPLSGVTVISLAVNLPGPLAAARLHALGARVIKVEPPIGDPLNLMFPAYYQELTDGQEIRTIDLKDDEGIEQLRTLLAGADLLLTSMRPRAAAALGLSELVNEHGLVHVEIVGFAGDRADVPPRRTALGHPGRGGGVRPDGHRRGPAGAARRRT